MVDVTFDGLTTRVRQLFQRHGVTIPPDSHLAHLLQEVDLYQANARDRQFAGSRSGLDDLLVSVGSSLLVVSEFDRALRVLVDRSVPHLVETMRTLVTLRHGNAEQEMQFSEASYELYAGAEFITKTGMRPSYLRTNRPSRYRRRVEFLLRHRWPVECKRARVPHRLLPLALAAAEKINERAQPGLVCLNASELFRDSPYAEAENLLTLANTLTGKLEEWLFTNTDRIRGQVLSEYVVGLVLDWSVLAYYHDSGNVAAPSFRVAIIHDRVIRQDVLPQLVNALQAWEHRNRNGVA